MAFDAFVIAGNGPSIKYIKAGQVLASDFMVRTNNFFFETKYYLGRRVDLAFMGGDPRVAPYMFSTLAECKDEYQIKSWSSHRDKVVQTGMIHFTYGYTPMLYKDRHIKALVNSLSEKYGKTLTTGAYAAIMAHAKGGKYLILAGIDLYAGKDRYSFRPGSNHEALLGKGLAKKGFDTRLHCKELELEFFEEFNKRDDVELMCIDQSSLLGSIIPIAPPRQGSLPVVDLRTPPKDWINAKGYIPMSALRFYRKARAGWKRYE
ncbi:alpha-2,3-sialyltransferase [Maritalea myrionectae]|uniref:alpha-2,3-sialyltransferase n=1 Tax=Maritalea myrionectae TaxID=454601 RepID=UPI0013C2AB43|nr:alpha-2,3-sialyltransferase [Maritalea myrionectae]